MTRRALVLSGGGARGSFEVGVIEELVLNRGLDFHIFCGISAGALNAAVLAQARADSNPAVSLANLQDAARTLRTIWLERITGTDSILRQRLLGIVGAAVGADSILDVTALEHLLEEFISPHRLSQSGRALRIQYAALETGALTTVIHSGQDIVKGVLASASVPVFFPPVQMGGEHLVDGGVRNVTPLATAFDSDPPPDVVYVVYASPRNLAPASYTDDSVLGLRVSARDYLMRALEILINEIDITDVEGAVRLNTLKMHWGALKPLLQPHPSVDAIDEVLGPIRYAKIVECRPEEVFISDGLSFIPQEIRASYEHGKARAAKLPREEDVV